MAVVQASKAAKNFYSRTWFHAGGIIRKYRGGYQAEINRSPKRIRKTLPSLDAAKTYLDQKKIELVNEGTQALTLTEKQKRDAVDAISLLEGIPLAEAARFYTRHHKPVGGVRTVRELFAEYIDAKVKANRRKDTINDIRTRVGVLVKLMGDRPVHTITAAELEQWLDQNTQSPVSRDNYRRAFVSFLNFARKKKLVEFNPAESIERPKMDESLPEILTPAEVERILRAASELYPRLIPMFAIGFFAGLRSAEIAGTTWASIDFDSRLITVRPEVAKKRRQRHVTIADNLLAWLLPYRQESSPVCPADSVVRRWRGRILKEARLESWPHNGMRHSFASYHLAKHGDISRTALELGHTRPDILFNHYRNLVKPTDAEKYWTILPQEGSKVITFAHTG